MEPITALQSRKATIRVAANAFYEFVVETRFTGTLRVELEQLFASWKQTRWKGRSMSFSEVLFAMSRLNLCKVRGEKGEQTISWTGSFAVERPALTVSGENESLLVKWLRLWKLDELLACFGDASLESVLNLSGDNFNAIKAPYSLLRRLEDAINQTKNERAITQPRDGVIVVGHGRRISLNPSVVLGKGSSGTRVFLGWVEGREVAVKRMARDMWDLALKEINSLQEARSDESKYLVSYFGSDKDESYIYLALSRCATTLGQCLNNQGEMVCQFERIDERIRVLRELSRGISDLHGLGVIHRDLTPSNVLLSSDGVVRISDMGLARKVEDGADHVSTTSQGTAGWQPIEVLERAHQSESVDVFSYGCLAFYVLTLGEHPFGEPAERVLRIQSNKINFGPLHRMQGVLNCKHCPKKRFNSKHSLQQHIDSLEHPDVTVYQLHECPVCAYEYENGVEDWDEHEHDVSPSTMFAAEELISRCLMKSASDRPTIQQILLHPLFWSHGKALRFLEMVSDWLKMDKLAATHLNTNHGYIYGANAWATLSDVAPLLKKAPKRRRLSGLLRLIRNIAHHFQEEPKFARFESAADVFEFFERRFPNLLIEVWTCIRDAPNRSSLPDLAQFYP